MAEHKSSKSLVKILYMRSHGNKSCFDRLWNDVQENQPPLKLSSNETGYWKVGIVKNMSPWKYKAFKPGPATSSGCMIKKSEGGGYFDTPVEAAQSLRTYCISNNIQYR